MSRLAIINITKDTYKLFRNKTILNPNVLVSGNEYFFQGNFTPNTNLYVNNSSDLFVKNNIDKLLNTKKLFLENIVSDCKTLYHIQNKLNTNIHFNIYINHMYYEKFLNYLESSSKFNSGCSYDNSNQIFPMDIQLIKNSFNIIEKESLKFK
jgi:hypothetical protein